MLFRSNTEQIDKVPFLGDIPFIGALFSHRAKTSQRRERLFLIRPRVVAINGKPVAQSWVEGLSTALNATWGDKHPMMGGATLELAGKENTRLVRRALTPMRGVGPIQAGEYFYNDKPF